VELGHQLGITEENLEAWYKVTDTQIYENGGTTLLRDYYHSSLYDLLLVVFPSFPWKKLKFGAKGPRNSIEFQREFLEKLHREVLFVSPFPSLGSGTKNKKKSKKEKEKEKEVRGWNLDRWYTVTRSTIIENGGDWLLRRYPSMYKMLATIYPEHEWIPWEFRRLPLNFFKSEANVRSYFQFLREELGLHPRDRKKWYKVGIRDMRNAGGTKAVSFVRSHGLYELLTMIYPDYAWLPWLFHVRQRTWFVSFEKQRTFLDFVAAKLGQSPSVSSGETDATQIWYQYPKRALRTINHYGGSGLLNNIYKGSLYEFLSQVYSDQKWDAAKLPGAPVNTKRLKRA